MTRHDGLSNRQRRLAEKACKAKRTQGAGRPKSANTNRYPSGDLRPPPLNETVIGLRRALLGKPEAQGRALDAAESPLALAYARSWLTKEHYVTALAYGATYRAAGVDLPTMRVANMDGAGGGRSASIGDAGAMNVLRACWMVLTTPERSRLLDLCIREEWPAWLIARLKAPHAPEHPAHEAERVRLENALDAIAPTLGTESRRHAA